jgi:hypothetical protein
MKHEEERREWNFHLKNFLQLSSRCSSCWGKLKGELENEKKSLSQPGAWRGEFKRCVNRTVSIKNFFLPPLSFSLADVTVKSIELDDGCAELKRCEY